MFETVTLSQAPTVTVTPSSFTEFVFFFLGLRVASKYISGNHVLSP